MSNTVPAAAIGLPSTTRRTVLAGIAVATSIAAPAAIAGSHADAELLRLYGEWLAATKTRDAAMAEFNRVEEIICAHKQTMPKAAKFKHRSDLVGEHDVPDDHWDELTELATGGPGSPAGPYQFTEWALEELQDGIARTEWTLCPNSHWLPETSPDAWRRPYPPVLRKRVQEILAAWEPWEAEQNRLRELHRFNDIDNAFGDAQDACREIEEAIAATPATTLEGVRAKATILASQGFRLPGTKQVLADYLSGEKRHADGMKASLLLDLADWQAIA